MKTKRILAAVILALIAVSAHSHAAIAYLGGTYSDNLDGMGNSSSWINDSTLPGWYAYKGTSNDVNSPGEPQEQWGLIGSSFAPGNGGRRLR